MKQTVLTALVILSSVISTTVNAQPTLTAATSNPLAGDIFYGHDVDVTGLAKGAAGAGVSWSFPTFTEIMLDTTSYLVCSATPYCDSFAGSNIVSYDNTDYLYGVASTSALRFIGGFIDGQVARFTKPQTYITYPFTYNSIHKDTAAAFVSSFGLYFTITDSAIADAYGTLTLPSGTFTNVLRVHLTSVEKDSFNIMGMPIVTESQTETYSWYVAGFHNPLLSMTYDTSGTGSPALTDAKYFTRNHPTAISNVTNSGSALQVYPNPASDKITIICTIVGATDAAITLSDLTGRVVASISAEQLAEGANTVNIPVSNLANGIYIVNLRTAAGSTTQKVVVSK